MSQSADERLRVIEDLRSQIDALESDLAKLVRTQQVEIVDSTGKMRGSITVDSEETVALSLCDGKGVIRTRLSVAADGGASLVLSDATAAGRITLELADGIRPLVWIRGEADTPDVRLEVREDGSAGLFISSQVAEERIEFAVDPSGVVYLLLRDRSGAERRIQGK